MASKKLTDVQNEAVAKEFDQYHDTYSQTVNDALIVPGLDVEYFTRVKASVLLDLAGDHFGSTKGLKLADIGCGIGNYHPLLVPHVGSLSGVDVSAASIDEARKSNPSVNYAHYDGVKLPFADNTFDVAYAICVVHHVPVDLWPNFFREMHRVVRPGGLAMIFEHNPLNPLTMRVVNRCPFDRDAVLLKRSKTASLLDAAGFGIKMNRTILSLPSFNRLTRSLDLLMGVMPLGAQYVTVGSKGT